MTEMHKIDPPQEPSPAFLNARMIPGRTLQSQFGLHPSADEGLTAMPLLPLRAMQ
jgi:hypothetical protein